MPTVLERRYALAAVLSAAASAGVLRVFLPWTGVGADGVVYAAMARHPFHTADQLGPYPFRVLIPLLVWLLPLPRNAGFHVLAFAGLVAGGTMVALLARDIGVRPTRALAAAPLYVLSFAGVYGLYQYRMIDSECAALTAGALLLTWRGRKLAFVVVAMVAASAREYGGTLPLAWWAAQRGRGRELQAVWWALVLGIPVLTVYFLVQTLPPHPSGGSFMFRNGTFDYYAKYGLLRYFSRSFVQGFGLLFLAWPIGFALGSSRWRSFHLYLLGIVPFMIVTDFNRTIIYILPFAIPSALLMLDRASQRLFAVAVVASAYVAVGLSLHNLPNNGGYPAGNAIILPGAILGVAALLPAARASLREVAARLRPRATEPQGA
jgi:hypothetical protein